MVDLLYFLEQLEVPLFNSTFLLLTSVNLAELSHFGPASLGRVL